MFDLFLLPLLLRASIASARRRFWSGLVAASFATIVWALLFAAGWYGRGADAWPLGGAMLLVFLGPSVVPGPTAQVPLSSLLASHPIATKALLGLLLLVPFALTSKRAQRFSPLSDEAADESAFSFVFLLPALLLLAQTVCLGVAAATVER